jgi:hypothetical protein
MVVTEKPWYFWARTRAAGAENVQVTSVDGKSSRDAAKLQKPKTGLSFLACRSKPARHYPQQQDDSTGADASWGRPFRTRTQDLQGRRLCRNPGSRLPAFGPYIAVEPRLSGHVAFYQSNAGPRFGHIQERFSIFLIFCFCCPSNAFASVSPVIVQTCHLCISAVIALPEKRRRTPQSSLSI